MVWLQSIKKICELRKWLSIATAGQLGKLVRNSDISEVTLSKMNTINIKSHGDSFHAGTTDSGSMVLMGLLPVELPILGYLVPRLVLIWFDTDGALSFIEMKRVTNESQSMPDISSDDDPEFRKRFLEVLETVKAEIGFVEDTIVVQKFSDGQTGIGLDVRSNSGEIVLSWGNDYTLDVNGKVLETAKE